MNPLTKSQIPSNIYSRFVDNLVVVNTQDTNDIKLVYFKGLFGRKTQLWYAMSASRLVMKLVKEIKTMNKKEAFHEYLQIF